MVYFYENFRMTASKYNDDSLRIQFWWFHQLRKGHFRRVAWSTWLSRFSVWVGAIRRFILWSLTLVNIMSKRARMRIPSAWLAPKCRVWSRLALLLCLEVFDIFPSPFVGFDLKWLLEVGPTFYRNDLWWKFRLRRSVWNIKFGMVAYLVCVHGVPNEFGAPRRSF